MKNDLPKLADVPQPVTSFEPSTAKTSAAVARPKTQPAAVAPAVTTLSQKIADEQKEKFLEAERLLEEIVSSGRAEFTSTEFQFFQAIGWSQKDMNDQRRRVNRRMTMDAIAGTSSDRAAAQKERDTSAELLRTKGDELEQTIETLTKQLHSLQRDARLSAKRCEDMADAVSQLRELVPPFIKSEYDLHTQRIANAIGKQLSDLTCRAHQIECLTDPQKYNGIPGGHTHLDAVRCYDRSLVERNNKTDYLGKKWNEHVRELLAELAELRPQIVALQQQVDAELAACESCLDYYLR